MPACVDRSVEERRDKLLADLELCRKHREAEPSQRKVWDEAIDYLLTLIMELDLEPTGH